MNMRVIFVVLLAMLVAGCQLLPAEGGHAALEPVQVSVDVPEERRTVVLHEPVQTSRFELTDTGQRVVGQIQVIRAGADDTFVRIARSYNLGYDELLAANPGVNPWLPGEGTEIVLPTRFILPDAPREGIVINTAQMRLFHYERPDGEDGPLVVHTHPIGIGRVGWSTPTGETRVIDKAVDPTWYPPASVRADHAERGDPLPAVVPPGPDNPLGRHVFRLDMPGYLIHGTNRPPGVGMRVSAGCVRMYPEDIEALYPNIGRGTPVRLVNQPVTAAWHRDALYVDTHPLLEEDERDVATLLVDTIEQAMEQADRPLGDVDFRRAAQLFEEQRGIPLPVLRGSPGTRLYLAGVRRVENIVAPVAADADLLAGGR